MLATARRVAVMSQDELRKRRERAAARLERRREEELAAAEAEAESAGKMVEVLNQSVAVKKRRKVFAVQHLARQVSNKRHGEIMTTVVLTNHVCLSCNYSCCPSCWY